MVTGEVSRVGEGLPGAGRRNNMPAQRRFTHKENIGGCYGKKIEVRNKERIAA